MARVNIDAELKILAERKRLAEAAIRQESIKRAARAKELLEIAQERANQFISKGKAEALKSDPHAFLERNGWRFMGTTFYPGSKFPEAKWYANLEYLNTTQTFKMSEAIEITMALWLKIKSGASVQDMAKLGIRIPDESARY